MYQEYKNAYAQHSSTYGEHTAIFYLVGKFYEMYDSVDAITGVTSTSMSKVVDILGIQMSVRKGDGPNKSDGLFAGVPEQSLHKYAALLTRVGWTVVIYDQVKDAKGAVTERKVSRILTPGTHVEAVSTDACYIGGIWLEDSPWGSSEPPAFGLVAVDLTTGRIHTYEGTCSGKKSAWSADNAIHFFQVYCPRETTLWWRGDNLVAPTEAIVKRQFGLASKVYIQAASKAAQGGFEVEIIREEFLRRTIQIQTLLPIRTTLQISKSPRTERILCATLLRIEEIFPSGTQKFYSPAVWSPQSTLFLGNQALVQLNMISHDETNSVLNLFLATQTPFGRRAMRQRILYPSADFTTLKKYYSEIEVFDCLTNYLAIQTYLKQMGDLPRIHRRLINGDIGPSDILTLDQTYVRAKQIAKILGPTLLAYKGTPIDAMHTSLTDIFSVEKALKASDTSFCFQPGKAPKVDSLEAELERLSQTLKDILKTITDWMGLGTDALRYEFKETMSPTITGPKASIVALKRCLDAKNSSAPFKKMELITKKSSSHLEVPEVVSTWYAVQRNKASLQEAIRIAIGPLCDEIASSNLSNWDQLENWLALVDVSYTIWKRSKEYNFVKPTLLEGAESSISISGLRHPLIEQQATKVEYVKHNVELNGTETGWLVYGMNASGKSSLMKAVGIAVILAQAGAYVPATSFAYVPFQSLFTRILNADNLWAGLSSFAVEMTELREILGKANSKTLVLGDELCSGTESISATALVGASLQHLHKCKAKFIFATHFHGLLTIPSLNALPYLKVWHLKVRYDSVSDVLVYERTLNPGPGSSLYGLEVARAMNLPEEILQTALNIRKGLLGTGDVLTAPMSDWNPNIQRRLCEVCSANIINDLEVHHIQPRAETVDSHNKDGTHQNDLRNLIVVCSKCHDSIHNSTLSVGPVSLTSNGPKRSIVHNETSVKKKGLSDEDIGVIEIYLKNYPLVAPKRAIFDLEQKGISISAAALKTFRQGV